MFYWKLDLLSSKIQKVLHFTFLYAVFFLLCICSMNLFLACELVAVVSVHRNFSEDLNTFMLFFLEENVWMSWKLWCSYHRLARFACLFPANGQSSFTFRQILPKVLKCVAFLLRYSKGGTQFSTKARIGTFVKITRKKPIYLSPVRF